MGILEKISEIEKEISRTQKNKGKHMFKFYEIYSGLLIVGNLTLQNLPINSKIICIIATEYHLGTLKAKLAKYRGQLLEPSGKKGEKGEGFDVLKSGDARAVMIGFPSVGKVS